MGALHFLFKYITSLGDLLYQLNFLEPMASNVVPKGKKMVSQFAPSQSMPTTAQQPMIKGGFSRFVCFGPKRWI